MFNEVKEWINWRIEEWKNKIPMIIVAPELRKHQRKGYHEKYIQNYISILPEITTVVFVIFLAVMIIHFGNMVSFYWALHITWKKNPSMTGFAILVCASFRTRTVCISGLTICSARTTDTGCSFGTVFRCLGLWLSKTNNPWNQSDPNQTIKKFIDNEYAICEYFS